MAQFLTDGFRTLIEFSAGGIQVQMREREVTPPGYDLGGPIDTTTMRNSDVMTQAPKSLIKIDDIVLQVQYDPSIKRNLLTHMGLVTVFTVRYPDNTTEQVFGWIDSFKPSSHKIGDFALAEMKICVSNQLISPYINTDTVPANGPAITPPSTVG